MAFLDTVRSAAGSALAQFNTFLMEYKPNGQRVYAFLEGRDDPSFYRRLIADRLPAGYSLRLVRCENRRGVLDATQRFLSRYPADPRVIALIDKDHSDLVPGSASATYVYAFQTECYSVENYVCEPEVVRRFCVESLGVSDIDGLCDTIAAQYVRARERFYKLILRGMSWIVAARRRGDLVNLGNLDAGRCIELDDDLMPSQRMTDADLDVYLETVTGANSTAAPVPALMISSAMAELSAIPPKRWVRGKQELWLTASFIIKLAPAVKVKGVRSGGHVAFGYANALELLASRCDAPRELDAFLRKVFSEFTPAPTPA